MDSNVMEYLKSHSFYRGISNVNINLKKLEILDLVFPKSKFNFHFQAAYSTFKNSSSVPYQWMRNLNQSVVNVIESKCQNMMSDFG